MQPLTRQLSLALVLLVVFLAAAVSAEAWLQRESRRAHADIIEAKRIQLERAFTLAGRAPGAADPAFLRGLGDLLGGTVTLYDRPPPAAAALAPGWLGFDCRFPGAAPVTARVTFAAPAASRLAAVHERMLVVIILLALALLFVFVGSMVPRRPAEAGGSRTPWATARKEMRDLEQLARITVERSEALARETGARHRAEEDLQLSRTLLGQSQEARIRLGRDLHDNLCQTLYAVSLTLEGLRGRLTPDPGGVAAQRLDQSIAELRRLNHEFRASLKDLEPTAVQRPPFVEALDAMLAAQSCAEDTRLVRNIDTEAAALVPAAWAGEAVTILREAVSNSVRHGHPHTITIHAQRGDGSVLLAVQDDGPGFDAAAGAGGGHGLANMQARAEAFGGTLRVVSAPGKGTRILLTVPVSSAS